MTKPRRMIVKRKRPSSLDYLRNLQPTHVLQCLVDKHITICASGPELSVKMSCHGDKDQAYCITERRFKASHNKTGIGFTFKGIVREASENIGQQNTSTQHINRLMIMCHNGVRNTHFILTLQLNCNLTYLLQQHLKSPFTQKCVLLKTVFIFHLLEGDFFSLSIQFNRSKQNFSLALKHQLFQDILLIPKSDFCHNFSTLTQ